MGTMLLFALFFFSLDAETEKSEKKDFEKPNIKRNINHRLDQLGLSGKLDIFFVGEKGDYVYSLPVVTNGSDSFLEEINTNKEVWTKSSKMWTRLFHRSSLSWRSKGKSSLHVIVRFLPDKTRFYEMHIDNWSARGIKSPVNSVRHIFGEVLVNAVTGKSANQGRIERGLYIIDRKNKRKP